MGILACKQNHAHVYTELAEDVFVYIFNASYFV